MYLIINKWDKTTWVSFIFIPFLPTLLQQPQGSIDLSLTSISNFSDARLTAVIKKFFWSLFFLRSEIWANSKLLRQLDFNKWSVAICWKHVCVGGLQVTLRGEPDCAKSRGELWSIKYAAEPACCPDASPLRSAGHAYARLDPHAQNANAPGSMGGKSFLSCF